MRIPLSWLAEYVDLSGLAPERVAELLTLRTCEVEALHHVGEGLGDLLVGEVVEASKHGNADALRVTKVNVGRGELLPIVCGAPNVAVGQRVAVAVPGTRLPGGLEVGERVIRGEVSRGMICSEKELGLGDDHDGILVLEPEAAVGTKLIALPSITETVIEVDNKSVNHRPDLWGIYGFARELQAILRGPSGLRALPGEPFPAGPGGFPVAIEAPRLCARYLAAVVEGIEVAESPKWMQRRLRLVDARPISNVVDASNYVMFETGQPTHAFDRERLQEGRIVVRPAGAAERLVTLDGQERALVATDLVIADGRRAVGLAGVMGGADSEVRAATTAIVLESASFHAPAIRRTATRLGLRSEASSRFEKSLDPNLAEVALRRILSLLRPGFGSRARLAGPVTAAGPEPPKHVSIRLRKTFVEERLGLPEGERGQDLPSWTEHLDALGIRCSPGAPGELLCEVPSFRASKDLTQPIDLVEEIARLRGYETIEPSPLVAPVVQPPEQGDRRKLVRRVEDRLVALGFRGLESATLLTDRLVERFPVAGPFVALRNALVVDQTRVRRAVLPSLLALVQENLAHEPDLRLFEVGKGYRPEARREDPFVGAEEGEPREVHTVAGVVASPGPVAVDARFDAGIFFRAKAAVVALVEGLDLTAELVPLDRVARAEGEPPVQGVPFLHPRRQMLVGTRTGGSVRGLGYFGELHPESAGRLGLGSAAVAGFELDLEALEGACAAAGPRRMRPIPRFPAISVDVALAASQDVPVEALEGLVRAADPTLCRSVDLFDIYTGSELGAATRSVAFHVELGSDERTLTDRDAAGFLKAVAARAAAAGAALRGWQG